MPISICKLPLPVLCSDDTSMISFRSCPMVRFHSHRECDPYGHDLSLTTWDLPSNAATTVTNYVVSLTFHSKQ